MDIKGIIRNVIPFTAKAEKPEAQAEARSKTDASGDRDGNGQAGSEEQKRKTYSPEETQEVVKHLEGLNGVKDNGLTVRASFADGITVIFIEDRNGKTIRRIPESDFAAFQSPKKSGNLLNKTF